MTRKLFLPLLVLVLFVLGMSYFMTFTTLHFKKWGDHVVGIMQASYFAGMLAVSCFSDKLMARFGHLSCFLGGSVVALIGVLLMASSSSLPLWVVMRFSGGFAMTLLHLVVESWLLALGGTGSRGKIIAIYMISIYAAQSTSQYLLDLFPHDSLWPFVFTSSLLTLTLLSAFAIRIPMAKVPLVPLRTNIVKVVRGAPLGLVAAIVAGMLLAAVYSFVCPYAVECQLQPSLLMSVTIWGAVAFQYPVGWLSDRMDRRLLVACISIFTATLALAVVFVSPSLPLLLTFSFLLGGGVFTLYPQAIVMVASQNPDTNIAASSAIRSIAYNIGGTLGPLLVPVFSLNFGPEGLYLFMSTTALLFGIAVLLIVMQDKLKSYVNAKVRS